MVRIITIAAAKILFAEILTTDAIATDVITNALAMLVMMDVRI